MKLHFFLSCFLLGGFVFSQQTEYVDFKKGKANLYVDLEKNEVLGSVEYTFDILKETDSINIDAHNIIFDYVRINDEEMIGVIGGKNLLSGAIYYKFKPSTNNVISMKYHVQPSKALYFVDKDGFKQVWTQGQGKYTSNWLPSFDDVNEKVEFDLEFIVEDGHQVISNGVLTQVEKSGGYNRWVYDMQNPMSSYLVALAIGKYSEKTEASKSGIPLKCYYYPEDSLKVEPTYRYSKQMFDFLEEEIGVPYPWEIYKQVPVKDFLYSGMENTTLTIFSDALVVDSIGFKDRNYVNVNAHELAHQWFGDLVTATSGEHHWLQEGFATYYALLAEKDVFGEDYFYWKLYEYAQQLLEQEIAGKSTSLLDPSSSSLTFYQKGAWALHILKEEMGEQAFKLAVKNYLLKHEFKNVKTSDFIDEAEQASGQDLSEFVEIWLEAIELPQDAIVQSLKHSNFIQEYLDVSCEAYPSKCQDYLLSDISDKAKVKIVSQESYTIKSEDFNNSWEVRQAIAQNLPEIPLELKKDYETLLNDKSYVTIELALYNLWLNFPEDRVKYLQQTKAVVGFSDYNVRLLWLALNLNTMEYQPENKQAVFNEIKGYTSADYGFELRMNAFNFLKLINGFDEFSITNLMQATTHHNWRFQQFAKNLLGELKQNPSYEAIIMAVEIKE